MIACGDAGVVVDAGVAVEFAWNRIAGCSSDGAMFARGAIGKLKYLVSSDKMSYNSTLSVQKAEYLILIVNSFVRRKVCDQILSEKYWKKLIVPICDCNTSGKTFRCITDVLHIWGKNMWSMNIHRTWTVDVTCRLTFPLIPPVLKPDFYLQHTTIITGAKWQYVMHSVGNDLYVLYDSAIIKS